MFSVGKNNSKSVTITEREEWCGGGRERPGDKFKHKALYRPGQKAETDVCQIHQMS